jgi:hypothetical protein
MTRHFKSGCYLWIAMLRRVHTRASRDILECRRDDIPVKAFYFANGVGDSISERHRRERR